MRIWQRFVAGIGVGGLLGLLSACGIGLNTSTIVKGSGTLKTEIRQVSNFTAVTLDGTGVLTITQTGQEGLSVTADDNLLPLINTNVEGTTLHIYFPPNTNVQPSKTIVYLLSVKNLSAITLNGAATVATPKLVAPSLAVNLSGAGVATLQNLALTDVTVHLSGAGNLTLAGRTQTQTVTSTGAGTYHADQLASQTATVTLNGAGSAFVRVSTTLTITITGVGSLTYFGSPTITKHVTGIGTIHQGGA